MKPQAVLKELPTLKHGISDELQYLMDLAKKGEINGIVYMIKDKDGDYLHGRANLRSNECVLMASRMLYKYNVHWDEEIS